jgi:hypothetical protein
MQVLLSSPPVHVVVLLMCANKSVSGYDLLLVLIQIKSPSWYNGVELTQYRLNFHPHIHIGHLGPGLSA